MPEATPLLRHENAGFILEASPSAARFVLRGDADIADCAGRAFGVPIPQKPCRAERREQRAALWLGPDEWLLLAENEASAIVAHQLETALDGQAHSLVDVSQRQIGVRVSGGRAALVINAACPLDLSLRTFPVNAVARTILGKTEIILWRLDTTLFHIEVWRSFSDYLVALLCVSAQGLPGGCVDRDVRLSKKG